MAALPNELSSTCSGKAELQHSINIVPVGFTSSLRAARPGLASMSCIPTCKLTACHNNSNSSQEVCNCLKCWVQLCPSEPSAHADSGCTIRQDSHHTQQSTGMHGPARPESCTGKTCPAALSRGTEAACGPRSQKGCSTVQDARFWLQANTRAGSQVLILLTSPCSSSRADQAVRHRKRWRAGWDHDVPLQMVFDASALQNLPRLAGLHGCHCPCGARELRHQQHRGSSVHHHLHELLIVDLAVPIHICFPDHLVHILV